MKAIIILLLIIAILPRCVRAAELTDQQVYLETAWQILNVIDYGQTRDIAEQCANGGTYYELNHALGRCPTNKRIRDYFIGYAIGHYLVTRWLDNYRDIWLISSLVVKLDVVHQNYTIGLKVSF